jgi:hypothetical protein
MLHIWSGGGSGGGLNGRVDVTGVISSGPGSSSGGGFRGGLWKGETKAWGAQIRATRAPTIHVSSVASWLVRKTALLSFSGPFWVVSGTEYSCSVSWNSAAVMSDVLFTGFYRIFHNGLRSADVIIFRGMPIKSKRKYSAVWCVEFGNVFVRKKFYMEAYRRMADSFRNVK